MPVNGVGTMNQPELFESPDKPPEYWWDVCFGWAGPETSGYCSVNSVMAKLESGGQAYAYGLRCRLVGRVGDDWLAEVDTPGIDWHAGRLVLAKADIWPPVCNKTL